MIKSRLPRLLAIVVGALVVFGGVVFFGGQHDSGRSGTAISAPAQSGADRSAPTRATPTRTDAGSADAGRDNRAPRASSESASARKFGLPSVAESALPVQARQILALIRAGGPYPYERDGIVFGNLEGLLPKEPRGYYHEFTVPTPGEETRGAKRIVTGKDGEKFYSDDHYESFSYIQEGR